MENQFIASLNSGSLRKLGEKTGTGMVNRFGPQIKSSLDKTGWDGDVQEVKHVVGDILTAMGPAILVEVMAYLGYEYDPANDSEGVVHAYGDDIS